MIHMHDIDHEYMHDSDAEEFLSTDNKRYSLVEILLVDISYFRKRFLSCFN